MFTFFNHLSALVRDERGVTALEYGLIAGLVALGLVASHRPGGSGHPAGAGYGIALQGATHLDSFAKSNLLSHNGG